MVGSRRRGDGEGHRICGRWALPVGVLGWGEGRIGVGEEAVRVEERVAAGQGSNHGRVSG